MGEIHKKEEIAQIFIANKALLLNIALTYMPNRESAEDIVSDAILAVLEHDLTFKSEASCVCYIKQTIRNKALNIIRRKYNMEPTEADDMDAQVFKMHHPDAGFRDIETHMLLRELLKDYSAKIQEAFVLYVLDDMPIPYLANQLEMKPDSLRRQFSRMQKRLQELPEEKKLLLLMLMLCNL